MKSILFLALSAFAVAAHASDYFDDSYDSYGSGYSSGYETSAGSISTGSHTFDDGYTVDTWSLQGDTVNELHINDSEGNHTVCRQVGKSTVVSCW